MNGPSCDEPSPAIAEIDLDAVMAEVHAAVEDKRRRGLYSDAFLATLEEPLDIDPDPVFASGPRFGELATTAEVHPWGELVSVRPVIGPVIVFGKRVVRRALRWYLAPVTEQVTTHNTVVVDVLTEQSRQITRLIVENDRLRRELSELRREVREGH